jgi:hypothetical protein
MRVIAERAIRMPSRSWMMCHASSSSGIGARIKASRHFLAPVDDQALQTYCSRGDHLLWRRTFGCRGGRWYDKLFAGVWEFRLSRSQFLSQLLQPRLEVAGVSPCFIRWLLSDGRLRLSLCTRLIHLSDLLLRGRGLGVQIHRCSPLLIELRFQGCLGIVRATYLTPVSGRVFSVDEQDNPCDQPA